MKKRDDILGVDWNNVGRQTLGVNAMLGKTLLNAFGAGAVVAPIEAIQMKGGVLPAWATKSVTVMKPDFIVVTRGDSAPEVMKDVTKAVIFGGTKIDGTAQFNFGFDAPARLDVERAGGAKAGWTDVKQVLVSGGTIADVSDGGIAGVTKISGEDMTIEELNDVVLEVLGDEAVVAQPSGFVLAPPSDAMLRTPEYLRARAIYERSQQRLAEARARQPVKPATLSPLNLSAPNLDLKQYLDGSLNMDDLNNLGDQVLGELEYEVLGGEDDGWTEIVGDDYVHGTDVLVGANFAAQAAAQAPKGAVRGVVVPKPSTKTTVKLANGAQPTKEVKPNFQTGAASKVAKSVRKRAKPSAKPSVYKTALAQAAAVKKRGDQNLAKVANKLKLIKQRVAGKTAVAGVEFDVLGAAPKKVPTTAKQKASASRLERARKKLELALKALQKKQEKTAATHKKLEAAIAKAQPVLAKMVVRPKGAVPATRVHGDDVEVLDQASFTVGEEWDTELNPTTFEVLGLAPGDEGYDPRFDDPNYSGDYGASGGSSSEAAPLPSPGGNLTVEDFMAGPLQELPRRGEKVSEEDAKTEYTSFPPDAVFYLGTKGFPADSVGSWSVMYDKTGLRDGFKFGFGRYRNSDQDLSGTPDWVYRDALSVFKYETGREYPNGISDETRKRNKLANPMKFWTIFDEPNQVATSVPDAAMQSQTRTTRVSNDKGELVGEYQWGPFVGNPNGVLAGLRYCPADGGAFFWLPNQAPKWATAEADAEVQRLNDQIKADAKEQYDLWMKGVALEEAERERNQAATEHDLNMATNQAEVESAINADKLAQQQAAMDAQAIAMQTALDLKMQQADAQYGIQQDALMQRAQQADLEYAIAHPEVAMQDQEQGEDNGWRYDGEMTDRQLEENALAESATSSDATVPEDFAEAAAASSQYEQELAAFEQSGE